jgi:hypothetical protein
MGPQRLLLDKEALVVLGNKVALRIARKGIVLNLQNMRWECGANGLAPDNQCRSAPW